MCKSDEKTTAERREQLNIITQKTRFVILQNIIAHPRGTPSLEELNYMNPSKSRSTIRDHIKTLTEADIIETVKLPPGKRERDLPYVFYQLTKTGEHLLRDHGLIRAEKTLKEMHTRLEKTPEIKKCINAPRP